MKTVVVSGADRNIGLEMCREFLKKGWKVYAGKFLMSLSVMEGLQKEYPGMMEIVPLDTSSDESVKAAAEIIGKSEETIDMVVHNAAGFDNYALSRDIKGDFDFSMLRNSYNTNALGAMRLVNAFLPLMENGLKRFCFTSSEAGVVAVSHRDSVSGYGMSKTALNMAIRIMFNDLQPKGFTFRVFHPGWVRSNQQSDDSQAPLFHEGGKFSPAEAATAAIPQFIGDRDWEDRLVIIDNEGAAWPF